MDRLLYIGHAKERVERNVSKVSVFVIEISSSFQGAGLETDQGTCHGDLSDRLLKRGLEFNENMA